MQGQVPLATQWNRSIIDKVYVELGDKVKPGQMLVSMRDPFAMSRLATANAVLQGARVGELRAATYGEVTPDRECPAYGPEQAAHRRWHFPARKRAGRKAAKAADPGSQHPAMDAAIRRVMG